MKINLLRNKIVKLLIVYIFFLFAGIAMHWYFFSSGAYFNEYCCDSVRQISYFYPFLERMFMQGDFFWSWNYGLGGDIFGQFLYYFTMSPFFWVSIAVFDFESLRDVFEARLLISIGKLSISMIFGYHLFRYLKRSQVSAIIGSVIYGGSLYFTFYSLRYDFMVDGMVWLPLLLLGYERYLRENKKGLFFIVIFLVVSSNFYLAYINSIYLGLYSIFKYFILHEKYSVRSFFLHLIRFIGIYLAGLLLASVSFLPAINSFLQVDRFYYEHNIPALFPLNFYQTMPYSLFFSGYLLRMIIMLPVIVSLLIVFGIFTKRQETRKILIFNFLIFVMYLIPYTYSIFNGFSSMQYRWLYLFVFTIAYSVTFILDEIRPTVKQMEIYLGGAIVGLFAALVYWKYEWIGIYANKNDLVILSFVFIGYLLLLFRNKIPKKMFSAGLIVIFLLNTTFNNYMLFDEFMGDPEQLKANQERLLASSNYGIPSEQALFKQLKEEDPSFYRIVWNSLYEYNAPLLYGYNGFSAYNSLISGDVHRFLKKDYNTLQDNTPSLIKNVDNRIFLETALANKYYLLKQDEVIKPFGYSKWKSIGDYNIYKNDYFLPIGFMYNEVINLETFNNLSYSQKDELLLKAAVLDEPAGTMPILNLNELTSITKGISVDMIAFENAELRNGILRVENNGRLHTPVNALTKPSEMLFEINLNRIDGQMYTIEVNQKTFKYLGDNSIYNYPKDQIVFNLGYENKDLMITLTPGEYKLGELKLHLNTLENYKELVKERRKQEMKDIQITNHSVKGKIDANQDGILYLSIPYSNGWKAEIDGKKAEVIRVNKAFIGIPLSSGFHTIELNYVTPYVIPGILISLGTLVMLVMFQLIARRKRRI